MVTTDIKAYLKILFAIAWADKKVTKEEFGILNKICNLFELSENEKKEIEGWKKKPVLQRDLDDLNLNSLSKEQKKHILVLSMSVAKADGIVCEDEISLIEYLIKTMSLENISFCDLDKEIEEDIKIYGGVKRHNSLEVTP